MEITVLIAEDEENIRKLVASYLTREGYRVIQAKDGQEAVEYFEDLGDSVSLVVLDIMMPRMDGYEVCRKIRELSDVPVVMLTARDTEYDEINGFAYGADEYISKPFSPAILIARIKNLLRRSGQGQAEDYKMGNLEIRYQERMVLVDGKPIILTPREFDLLCYLVQNRNIALSREQILTRVWDADYDGDDRTVDTHIKCLRAKLKDAQVRIATVRKVGYKFEV
ncbi:MAG TPA: response regulator transcription factor [Firmicutes bacterium]|nr:response regulator transcription factor [Bacillota bacterium]